MYRTHHCGELTLKNVNEKVTLSGWINKVRDKGFIIWIDLRDREGVTQLIVDEERSEEELLQVIKTLRRESVIKITGTVVERDSKNHEIKTGEIEVLVESLIILNPSRVPPFTIENNTDGGEELRMKYRYLDLRRPILQNNIHFRHKISLSTRNYLSNLGFFEIETPYLIKSTPEGARDFVVPSRANAGEFYALPQSPQTFKQLLMISGYDKYFQITRCFRDEDLRSDRQPEFTQIDCEMSFVSRRDILNTFEGLIKHLFRQFLNIDLSDFTQLPYQEAMDLYGTDKPDIRFKMHLCTLTKLFQGYSFPIFDNAEEIVGIILKDTALSVSRKKIESWTNWIKRPQIGANGLIWLKLGEDNSIKSSISKFYTQEKLQELAAKLGMKKNDMLLILAGKDNLTRRQMGKFRSFIANELDMIKSNTFAPLWIVDFPLLEWEQESKRYNAIHHPFTSPKEEDISLLNESPNEVRANSYDLVINGVEIGGGSIRIHNAELQKKIFSLLGLSIKEAQIQFGFLLDAFEFGAPPHGGIAFGLDRLVAMMHGQDNIKDFIAFPKNNQGRDVMIDSPSPLNTDQLKELNISLI